MEQDPRYPIGKYEPLPYSEQQKEAWLADIKFLPQLLENAVNNLDAAQLDTPYRDGGWMVKQVVHHVADSHLNAYTRFKLGMSEELPSIKPYDEVQWAEMKDSLELPINISLTLLHALHTRWYYFLTGLTEADYQRKVFHPEHKKEMTLWHLLGMYAWHGRHHVAHITALREKMKW
ncbi:MAG: bacillithiol transferase BstA [Bacteroidetes bacterium]|nr:bacillithiol transferase BstA [Bacteroidota bacterium]